MVCKINIEGEIVDGLFERFRRQMTLGATSLEVFINSEGGRVQEGFWIRDFVKALKIPTKCIIGDLCASIATIIALSFDEVEMQENGIFLIHNPFLPHIPCDVIKCDADTLIGIGMDMKDMENEIYFMYQNKSMASREDIYNFMRNEIRLSAEQALAYGFIDKILPLKKKPMNIIERISAFFSKPENIQKFMQDAQNLDITLDNGAILYVETEDGEIEGKSVYSADTGEPAPDGVHKLQDGREITVSGGIITSVSMTPENATIETEIETELPPTMTSEAIEEMVAKAVATALASFQKQSAQNSKQNQPPAQAKPTYTPARKAVAPHKFDGVANYLVNKWNPAKVAKDAVITPNYDTIWTGTWVEEILIQPAVSTPDFMRLFTVIDNVRYQQVLSVAQILGKITVGYRGCGTPTATGSGAEIGDRVLQTAVLEIYLEQCANDFNNKILMLWQKSGINRPDLTGTVLEGLMLQLILEAMQRDLFALFSFGDKDLNLTLNPDYKYYNAIDGLWTVLLADSTTQAESCVQRFSAITVLNQDATTATRAEDYLRQMYENSPSVLRQMAPADKAFYVTQNVYDNYLHTLQSRTGVEGAWIMLQDGSRTLSFNGIPVIPFIQWDVELNLPDNPLNGVYNTLMLYTSPKNHYIGIDGVQNEVRSWYDPNTDLNKFRAMPVMGYNYVMCDLQSIKVGKV